jgi:hypothetical protein
MGDRSISYHSLLLGAEEHVEEKQGVGKERRLVWTWRLTCLPSIPHRWHLLTKAPEINEELKRVIRRKKREPRRERKALESRYGFGGGSSGAGGQSSHEQGNFIEKSTRAAGI